MKEPVVSPATDSNADRGVMPTELFHHIVLNMIVDYVEWEIPTPELFPAFLIGQAPTPGGISEVAISPGSFRDREGTSSGEKLRDCLGPDTQPFRLGAALVISGGVARQNEAGHTATGLFVFFITREDVEVRYRDVVRDGQQWSLGPEDWRTVNPSSTLEAIVAPIISVIRAP
jgi:hypothetical protein